ncbi:hypothetical protein [Desulfopila aestuarii]|uniref:Uncharacterized protein n=1 Tax=Desulfopila aestuarii DSM 18488 TaxID=1121416 RepID=A0A1M7Y4R8_9BACT|nr:hypothetical protein [Desulfopila aestuarii]SHO47182.1 hypothetical protein SAMN02745220_01773 [Desulfopila aestuarii DSM 18488]
MTMSFLLTTVILDLVFARENYSHLSGGSEQLFCLLPDCFCDQIDEKL